MIGMMRPVLHRILLDRAAKEGIEVRTGTSPTQIDQQAGATTVTFSTGERRDYDLVVGADGLNSTVRDLVLGPIRPDFRGQGIFRVILPRPEELTAHAQFHPGRRCRHWTSAALVRPGVHVLPVPGGRGFPSERG